MKRLGLLALVVLAVAFPASAVNYPYIRLQFAADCTVVACTNAAMECENTGTATLFTCNTATGFFVAIGGGAGGTCGTNTEVNFNDGESCGADTGLVFSKIPDTLTIGVSPSTTQNLDVKGNAIFRSPVPLSGTPFIQQGAINLWGTVPDVPVMNFVPGGVARWQIGLDAGGLDFAFPYHYWNPNISLGADVFYIKDEVETKVGLRQNSPAAQLDINNQVAANPGLIVRAFNGQTAPIFEVRASASGTATTAFAPRTIAAYNDSASGVTLVSSDATMRFFSDNNGNLVQSLGTKGVAGANTHIAATNGNAAVKHSELRFNLDGTIGLYADYTHRADGTDLASTLLQRFGIAASGVTNMTPDGTNGVTISSLGLMSKLGTGSVQSDAFVGAGSTTLAVDLGTGEVAGLLPAADVGNGLTDAQVSDTLTCSIFKGSGTTTDAIDLATAEVAGNLGVSHLNSGTNASASTFWRGDQTWATPAGSGDITDVGPGCANGACWTNGLATTGSVLLDWEGTTVDANDFTFNVPTDPSAGISWTIPNTAASLTFPSGTDNVVARASTDTLTNKTLDVEGTGNTITTVSKIWLPAGTCQNATATINFDTPTTNAPVAACITGTNTQKAVLDFDPTTAQSVQGTTMLPSDGTGAIDVRYKWLTVATSGTVAWCLQLACVSDGVTDDPAFPAVSSSNCISDTAKGTANQTNDAIKTSVPANPGCSPGDLLHYRISRDPAEVSGQSDTLGSNARLIGVELTIRRAQ